jgi:DNA-binding transcriptional LysR family regulator
MHSRLAWEDLQFVLAVGRSGSLSGAARTLDVNHSTVFRRISQAEEKLGVRLFNRQREGYTPTPSGDAMIAVAQDMERDILALERRLAGEDLRPAGTVRLATTDTLLPLLLQLVPQLAGEYPDIRLELVAATQMANLTRRDADLALRATTSPEAHLVGRKLAPIAFAVYAAKEYIARADSANLEGAHAWIGLDETLAHTAAYRWLETHAPPARTRLIMSSLSGVLLAARAGNGLALLPCYMADSDSDLVRCSPVLPEVSSALWLLVHSDLRKVARVRAVMDFLAREITSRISSFSAHASTPALHK